MGLQTYRIEEHVNTMPKVADIIANRSAGVISGTMVSGNAYNPAAPKPDTARKKMSKLKDVDSPAPREPPVCMPTAWSTSVSNRYDLVITRYIVRRWKPTSFRSRRSAAKISERNLAESGINLTIHLAFASSRLPRLVSKYARITH